MNLLNETLSYEQIPILKSVSACFIMASVYVGSLYLWRKENRYKRDDPKVIKRRFVSVSLSSVISLLILFLLGEHTSESKYNLANWIGFCFDSPWYMLKSTMITLFLTIILFFGPLVQFMTNYTDNNNNITSYLFYDLKWRSRNLSFWRNYLISPFTEEFVFRSCMLPLLVPKLRLTTSIFVTPLFFGLAHLHHIIEGLKTNTGSFSHLLVQHLFQFSYTYVFGVYSSYLFLRTGCFFTSFVCHSFCNLMGFPHLDELVNGHLSRDGKLAVAACYFVGFTLFFCFLAPFTEQHLFGNYLYLKFV